MELLVLSIFISSAILYAIWTWNRNMVTEKKESDESDLATMKKPLELANEIKSQLPEETQMAEKKIEAQQLEAIFNVMQKNVDKFGSTTLDDFQNQLKLYGL